MTRLFRVSKRKYLWAPVLFYLVFIFFLSSFSFHFPWFQNVQKSHADLAVHVVEYGLFGFLLGRALWHHGMFWRAPKRLFFLVVLIGAIYGATDEFHQSFVPHRDASASDFAADTVGVALGALFLIKKKARSHA